VWLIAIGLVFLVRDWAGWSWGQAWPLFVIAAAGASFVTSLLHRSSLDAGSWSLMWPIAWLVIGVVLLAATTGNLGADLGDLISRWWPVGLILVGAWFLVAAVWPGRRRPVESLTLPLGPSPGASIKLSFGGGVLEVGRATPGSLVSGTFQGGVRYRTHGPDTAELEPDTGRGWPRAGAAFRWAVGLTGEKPLDLRLDTGASRATVDLADLLVHRLEVHSGAADTSIRLPRAQADVVRTRHLCRIPAHRGSTRCRRSQIRSTMALGRVTSMSGASPRAVGGWGPPTSRRGEPRRHGDHGRAGVLTIRCRAPTGAGGSRTCGAFVPWHIGCDGEHSRPRRAHRQGQHFGRVALVRDAGREAVRPGIHHTGLGSSTRCLPRAEAGCPSRPPMDRRGRWATRIVLELVAGSSSGAA